MKSNSKKYNGFGLIEVIVSIAVIGIISLAIYTGYIFAVKNTKEGQVKQLSVLEGKKIIEEIKSQNIKLPVHDNDCLNIGDNIALVKQGDVYTRFLNDKFQAKDESGNDIPESSRKYAEELTITKTAIEPNKDGSVDLKYYEVPVNAYGINISNQIQNNSIQSFINEKLIPELEDQKEIVLSLYVKDDGKIEIKDFRGDSIKLPVEQVKADSGKINIVINFSGYEKRSNLPLKEVDINIYNENPSETLNIYVQKSRDVKSDIKIFKGKMNLYDNRPENQQEADIGELYNIKVELMDYMQYVKDQDEHTHDKKNNLFTTEYNQNIVN